MTRKHNIQGPVPTDIIVLHSTPTPTDPENSLSDPVLNKVKTSKSALYVFCLVLVDKLTYRPTAKTHSVDEVAYSQLLVEDNLPT